ncbi:PAS domain S-box protein [Azospirillum griseum]|nr:PAS domain S-box protein [Azospirillum griseum]
MQRMVPDEPVDMDDAAEVGVVRHSWRYPVDAVESGPMLRRVHPGDRARFVSDIALALADGPCAVCHTDHRALVPDGRTVWWHSVTQLRPGTNGGIRCETHSFAIAEGQPAPKSSPPSPGPDDRTLLQALIDSIPDLIFFKDPNSVYLGCNRAFADFLGRGVSEIVGRTDLDLVPEDRARYFQDRDAEVLRQQTPHRMEEWVTFPDGRSVLLETIKTPYYGPEGAVLGLVAVARNITEKARAEQERRESDRRLATLMGNLPGMAYRARPGTERSLLFASEGGHRLTGWPPTDLVSRTMPFETLIHPTDRDHVRQSIAIALDQGRPFTLSYRLIDRAGITRHVWEQGVGVTDGLGRVVAVEGFVTDISPLKTAEDSLRTLSLAVAQSPVGVLIADAFGRTIYLNPRFRTMTGRSMDTVPDIDAFIAGVAAAGPMAVADHHAALWRALAANQTWQTELPGCKPNGAPFWAAIRVAPLLDDDGRLSNLIATVDDVTARRQGEEQLRRAQKMQAVGVLAGGVAHDFNNILTAILGYSHLALDALPDDSAIRDDLHQVTTAAERARGLVQQLLAFARKEKLEREAVDLRDIVHDAIKLLGPTLFSGVEWSLQCGGDPVPVLVAPAQIHQVIVNLCKNAADAILDATPLGQTRTSGGVTVTVNGLTVGAPRDLARSDPARDDVNRARLDTGRYACVTVTDTGCGMDAAVQDRMFEPFFTTKPVDKGTGLGLAVVHGIVSDHGGVIDVTSAPGHGTAITVFLPLNDSGLPRRRSDDARRVLLLSGEAAMVGMAGRLLRSQGFRAVGTTDSRRGLALFSVAPDRFHLIVLVQNPAEPVWRLLTLARAFAAANPDVPILLCAAQMNDGETAAFQAAGVTCTMPTPLAPDSFITQVRALSRAGSQAGSLPAIQHNDM